MADGRLATRTAERRTEATAATRLSESKWRFIDNAINIGALTLSDEKELKSKRKCKFFFNMGAYSSGNATHELALGYAETIKERFGSELQGKHVVIYGVPEKGVGFAVAVAAALSTIGVDADWCFSRKVPKEHGDATGKPTEFVGATPKAGDVVILLDDVITTGGTKEEAEATIHKVSKDIKIIGCVLVLDRQEVGLNGKTAAKEFEEKTGIRIEAYVTASDINSYLLMELEKPEAKDPKNRLPGERNPAVTPTVLLDFQSYMRAYGSNEAIIAIGMILQVPIFNERYGVIPACDGLTLEEFSGLVEKTKNVLGVVGYKVGIDLINQVGLKAIREVAGPDVILIVDWQKWGGDIPDMNLSVIRGAKAAKIVHLINFPHSGPETQRSAVYRALQEGGVTILGGAWMTHTGFEAPIGPFTEEYLLNAYRIWARSGITTFIVPATKPDAVKKIVKVVEEEFAKLGLENIQLTFASPGIGAQGGDTKALLDAIGPRHRVFAIEGRAITGRNKPEDPLAADMDKRATDAVEKMRKLVSIPLEPRTAEASA